MTALTVTVVVNSLEKAASLERDEANDRVRVWPVSRMMARNRKPLSKMDGLVDGACSSHERGIAQTAEANGRADDETNNALDLVDLAQLRMRRDR